MTVQTTDETSAEMAEPPFEPTLVGELLRAFGKAVRAHQLYLPNNPMHARALAAVREAFLTVWNEADAITQANDSQYGLSSYVWTENLGRAHRVAAAIEAGMCFVNSQNVRDLRQPFGGTKASGTGREGGTWSYEVFCEPKNVAVSMGSHHIPHWGTA